MADLAAAALLLGLTMYALFGGADFGGGVWTALARGERKVEQRESLFAAIGPVWETNHVWLIFVVVVMFMAFPPAFSALFISLLYPLAAVLVGITFRGAAFAFRHFGKESGRGVPLIARTFEISSILTPFALGVCLTAAAGGKIGPAGAAAWWSPFTVVGGLVGVAVCAYLAPVYMTVRTRGALQEDFRRSALEAGIALGALTALEIPVALADAPLFAARLLSPLPLIAVAAAAASGMATAILLWRRRYFFLAQAGAGLTVVLTLAGFGAAMYPLLVVPGVTVAAAAAPPEVLRAFLAVLPVGLVILVPSLVFLYCTFGTTVIEPRR